MRLARRGGPIPPRRPSSAGSSQKDLDAPKELGLPSLEGGNVMLVEQGKGVQNGGGYKTRKGKACENETKEGPRTRVKTSGKPNNTPGWPNLHRTGPGREKHINRGAKASSLSLSRALGRSSPPVFSSTCPHALKMDFPAIF